MSLDYLLSHQGFQRHVASQRPQQRALTRRLRDGQEAERRRRMKQAYVEMQRIQAQQARQPRPQTRPVSREAVTATVSREAPKRSPTEVIQDLARSQPHRAAQSATPPAVKATVSREAPKRSPTEVIQDLAQSQPHRAAQSATPPAVKATVSREAPKRSPTEVIQDLAQSQPHRAAQSTTPPAVKAVLSREAPKRSPTEVLRDLAQSQPHRVAQSTTPPAVKAVLSREAPKHLPIDALRLIARSEDHRAPRVPLAIQLQNNRSISREHAEGLLTMLQRLSTVGITGIPRTPRKPPLVIELAQSPESSITTTHSESTISPETPLKPGTIPIITLTAADASNVTDVERRIVLEATSWATPSETSSRDFSQLTQEEINRKALEMYPCTDFSLKGLWHAWHRHAMGAEPVTSTGGKAAKFLKVAPTVLTIVSAATGGGIPFAIILGSSAVAIKMHQEEKEYVKALCVGVGLLPSSSDIMQTLTGHEGVAEALGKFVKIVATRSSKIVASGYTTVESLVRLKEGEPVDLIGVADGSIGLYGETFKLAAKL